MPPIEVPVATYQSTACELGGITVPFSDQQVQDLYPTALAGTCKAASYKPPRFASKP